MSVQTSPLAALLTLIGKEDGSAPVGRHVVGNDLLVSAQHSRHNPLDRESGTACTHECGYPCRRLSRIAVLAGTCSATRAGKSHRSRTSMSCCCNGILRDLLNSIAR